MTDDFVKRLRELARVKHSDVSIGDEAADEIERLRMTLRDHFAAKIASGMAAYSGTQGVNFGPGSIAERSYEIADAMIRARTALEMKDD